MIEDKIQSAIKPIISIYSKIELELIEKIAEHFNINEEFINSDYWYFEKLKELGGLNNETLRLLEEYTGKTRQELLKAMKDIGTNSIPVDQLNIATQKNALLNPETIINSTNIQNIIQYSYDEIEKSFLNLNKTIQEQVRQTYTDIITETYIKTNAGVCSYQKAILDSLDKLGDKGISILTYQDKNGLIKNYDVVGTVRRDLLVATRGLAGKVNEEVIKESGNHIVRVTNHFGARTGDGGEDYTNHAWWQEKQFFCWNYDGKATEEEKKLPDFMEHCNYGDVQGIVGINCKHLFTVWYGSTKKEDLGFTYDENKEQYEKTQKQRYLENGVRKWKRKQVIAQKAKDEEGYKKASLKTREWQERSKKFTEENDLRRDYTREHIKEYKNVTIREKNDIMKQQATNIIPTDIKEFYNYVSKNDTIENLTTFARNEYGVVRGQELSKILGYDKMPTTVSNEQFEQLAKKSNIGKLYRGVSADTKELGQKYINDFKYGQLYAGKGVYGNGTYVAYGEEGLKVVKSNYTNEKGNIMEMLLNNDTKTINFVELDKMRRKEIETLGNSVSERFKNAILMDNGYYASIKGYDAIILDKTIADLNNQPYIVILNRGKVIISE